MNRSIAAIIIVILVIAGSVWLFSRPQNESNPAMQANEELELPQDQDIEQNYDPVSIPAMMAKEYHGKDLQLGRILDRNSAYTRYYITYDSNGLLISGIMNVPAGTVPAGGFPVLILNHGYIDPAVYTNGRGLKREQDYLARQGYIVIHPDYRNHADSGKDPDADANFRLGYVEDVINAVMAVKNSELEIFAKDKIGMLGHSMGGGVAINIMVIKPDLVDAIVLFAPVSADAWDNYDRWIDERPDVSRQIIEQHGLPADNPQFWRDVSPVNFLDQVRAPVMLHHGTADADVPLAWSDELNVNLNQAGKEIIYHVYRGQPHEFTSSWGQVMQRTTEFFNVHVK